jgi:hypothetical protein
MIVCTVYLYIATFGANVRFCRIPLVAQGHLDAGRKSSGPSSSSEYVVRTMQGQASSGGQTGRKAATVCCGGWLI